MGMNIWIYDLIMIHEHPDLLTSKYDSVTGNDLLTVGSLTHETRDLKVLGVLVHNLNGV